MTPDRTHEMLDEIHRCDNATKRARLVERFHAQHMMTYRRVAKTVIRHTKIGASMSAEDITQEVAIIAHRLVEEWATIDKSYNWVACLHHRARSVGRDLAVSSASTGMTGTSTLERRRRQMARISGQLTQTLQRDPSPQEVVDEWNREALSRYGDPKRSGLISSIEDLEFSGASCSDPMTWNYDGVCDLHEDNLLSRHESEAFVAHVVTECGKRDPVLGVVAQARFAQWVEGEIPSAASVAKMVGLPYERTRRAVNRIRAIAAEILLVEFGVDGTDIDGCLPQTPA